MPTDFYSSTDPESYRVNYNYLSNAWTIRYTVPNYVNLVINCLDTNNVKENIKKKAFELE